MQDLYGRKIDYLRLSVTDLCNLRCRYCMGEEGICKKAHEEMLTEEEMIRAVRIAAGLGISKVRITGGEPLVKPNILSICRRTASVPGIREVCLTTNGSKMKEMADPLREAGVSRINISLDTLNPEKYSWITRRGILSEALEGIEASLKAGFEKVKINTVLMGGFNDDEIEDLAALTLSMPVDVRFIELMPMVSGMEEKNFLSADTVLRKLPLLQPLDQTEGVARLYRLPDGQGNIGLIRPISAHFCGNCNRIRLTADGKLKPCLHSSQEISIKGLEDDQMEEAMRTAIRIKPQGHEELSAKQPSLANRTMNRIGG